MTQLKDNINSQTGKHLTYEERVKIEAYKELGYSNREIGRILNRAPQTINNAVKRGTKKIQHKFVRRFIPKSKQLKEISVATISRIEKWMNSYPRKIMGYETAKEAFIRELELLAS